VVIGLDNIYFNKVVKEGLFQAYKPKAASKIKPELVFDPQYRMIPFDYGYVVFNYDREKLGRIPRSHRELLDPFYKGKIIIENPLTSSPGQVFLLTTIALYGEEGYLDYWRGLKKNLLTITPGWDEAYGIFTAGEAPIVLSYGTSPVYHLLYDQTERYQALVLDDSAYAQIEGMGIVKGSANLIEAQQLVEYLLSPEFQSLIPESQFMYPATTDAKIPAGFRIAAQAKRILNLPLEQVAQNLDRWLADWEKVMSE
jgi:thiamine transport system substrate-binding protein